MFSFSGVDIDCIATMPDASNYKNTPHNGISSEYFLASSIVLDISDERTDNFPNPRIEIPGMENFALGVPEEDGWTSLDSTILVHEV